MRKLWAGAVLLIALTMSASAQTGTTDACTTDRVFSTLVGAGLGGAAAAIPATVIHRHDQATSHRIVALSIPAGAVIGFLAAGRDHPCLKRTDSALTANAIIATRSGHARRGAITGAVIGGVLGAAGGTLYNVGCSREPCNATTAKAGLIAISSVEGAVALGLLGSLIGWAWPAGRQ